MESFTTSYITPSKFPIVIEPIRKSDSLTPLLEILSNSNDFLKETLSTSGAVLLRNFAVTSEEDFSAVIKNFKTGHFINYIGGDSPRTKLHEGIYTSTEAPPSIKIALHNELSFVKHYPHHIFFFCQVAPEVGGETIIADSRKVLQSINPEVRERWSQKGLKYVSCYHYKSQFMKNINRFHKSWINVFETDDKQEVERLCKENEFDFEWKQNDWLQISQTRPAVIGHPKTGEKLWFNQAHLFDFNSRLLGWWHYLACKVLYCRKHMRLHQVFFGDGTSIPKEDLYHVLDVLDANTVAFPWQKGDVLVLDNALAMHGRATFNSPRRVLTAMTGI